MIQGNGDWTILRPKLNSRSDSARRASVGPIWKRRVGRKAGSVIVAQAEERGGSRRGLLICAQCQAQTSVLARTLFQDTHLDVRTWFQALWWVCGQKNGVSALGLQRLLGLGSYESAWSLLHRLRRAMVRPGRDRLSGCVEVDESYWGGPRSGVRGHGARGKSLLLAAVQLTGKKIGRIRLARVRDGSAKSLLSFVQASVAPGGEIRSDGNHSYSELQSLGYKHKVTIVSHAQGEKAKMLPHVHLVVSLLKRWLLGTHQGGVQGRQLDYYLDEFTFRFNRRTSRSRGLLFYRLIHQAVTLHPMPFQRLIAQTKNLNFSQGDT